MRDFLEIFNKVTENCFNHCVISFFERDVSQQENICIDRCVTKFLKSSHVAMNTYVEIQPKMVEKRIQEFNEMTEKNNQLKNEDSAPVTN
ncbi:unnamed protein product [Nesidiocoris tenuis]|uniref:Mitochondrial import inner membrane translocase subunit n=1 Tax=Nesidiocoris tenuis TaxID=355587 RepID=A0A6H5FZY0_9HEMI|nr:unnamed protein product [Nesidiocoris tenuis]